MDEVPQKNGQINCFVPSYTFLNWGLSPIYLSLTQGIQFLEKTPEIEVAKVRQIEKTAFFYNSIPSDTPMYKEVKHLVENDLLRDELDKLSDDEIREICAYRSQLHDIQEEEQAEVTIYPCISSDKLAATARGIFISRQKDMATYISRYGKPVASAE